MNIKDAKLEITRTVQIYTRKDENGHYILPPSAQRPVLLIGPPGIGKTAIMQQIADECNIGLVSYTITHHTRQSAVGLPVILEKNFQGTQYSVTEYTMSEIIASVYSKIEETQCKEGILFIDEINCVSETLVPTMLQFLQNKTFGTHRVPDGWIIVAAGNPIEYNRSAREFDIVTLDRVKKIDVEPDFDIWKEYAYGKCLHSSVISFLNIHKDYFYHIENTASGTSFATARGWEDLSSILYGYEEMSYAPDEKLVLQYIQDEDISRAFAAYYNLYTKYQCDYDIPSILNGTIDNSKKNKLIELGSAASSDEKLAVTGIILDGLNFYFKEFDSRDKYAASLIETLQQAKSAINRKVSFENFIEQYRAAAIINSSYDIQPNSKYSVSQKIAVSLESCLSTIKSCRLNSSEEIMKVLGKALEEASSNRKKAAAQASLALQHGFDFVKNAFKDGPEILYMVSDLNHNPLAVSFISQFGCDEYFMFNDKLKFQKERQSLLSEIDNFIH